MKNFIRWLEVSFTPKVNKIIQIPVIAAVSSSMQKVIPFILTGSLVYFYNVFQAYIPALPDINPICNYSFGLISLLITFFVAQQFMEKLGLKEYMYNAGLAAVLVFIMVCLECYEGEEALANFQNVAGPTGILVGIVVGLYVSLFFYLYKKLHLLEKRDTVPDFLVSWIGTIIPTFVTLAVTMVLVSVLGIDVFHVIQSVFAPFFSFGQTLPGMIFCVFVPIFFYTLGISTWFWGAFTTPIYMSGIQANIDAVANGLEATNIVTHEVCIASGLLCIGGAGCTLILIILMLFSKSKTIRMKGKIFLGPGLFNINEPVVFGAPIIYNPVLMIPMWLCGIAGPIIIWIVFRLHLLDIPSSVIQIDQIPVPISSWLVTQDFRVFIWFALLCIVYFAIWYPFFKAWEKSVIEEESEENGK